MKLNTTKNSYERFMTDNPDLGDPRYLAYVASGGACWGNHFRKHHMAEFNKQYETVWLRNPQLWEADDER